MGLNTGTKVDARLYVFLIHTSIDHIHLSASYFYDQRKA